jgi:hypothetical protein
LSIKTITNEKGQVRVYNNAQHRIVKTSRLLTETVPLPNFPRWTLNQGFKPIRLAEPTGLEPAMRKFRPFLSTDETF